MSEQVDLVLTENERAKALRDLGRRLRKYGGCSKTLEFEAVEQAQLAKAKQHYEQNRLEEHEVKHIEIALKDHYKDEWCSVCDNIARKLGFSPKEE